MNKQEEQRGDRHQEEHEEQPHAEPSAGHTPPPLHESPDEVAGQKQQQDEDQGQVEDCDPVEEHRGQEIGGKVPALPEKDLEGHEHHQGTGPDEQDLPSVVPELLARDHRQQPPVRPGSRTAP